MTTTVAAIMAGGQSSRMGRDKAGIVWDGETLLTRAARVAQEAGVAVIVVGREQPEDWQTPGVGFVPDAFPGQGPLGGLATALQEAGGASVLALACDMPLLDAAAVRWLLAQEGGTHGVTVQHGGQWEPLFSVYTPDVLPLVRWQMAAGRRSLQMLRAAGQFALADAPPEVAAALVNVNTPEDLAGL